MPWSTTIEFADQWVKLCACDGIAEGLYRGSKYDYELDRRIPVNRYLCEQCADNMRETDEGEIRLVKPQRLPDEVWDEWEEWYEENAQ